MARVKTVSLTGTEYSEVLDIKGESIVRIGLPAEWQTADIWIEEQSLSGGKWRPIYDKFGDRIVIPARADQSIKVDWRQFANYDRLRLQSSQIQTSPRNLDVVVESVNFLVSVGDV
jgi:hypothetical protein